MSNQPKILLVEDEPSLHEVIKLNLELEDYAVLSVFDGQEVIPTYNASSVDLIILDIMLPNIDGFTLCQRIRNKDSNVAILMMSAKDDSSDKILGLKLGADDYLPKPFDLEELLLRVKALLKRQGRIEPKQSLTANYQFGSNTLNFNAFSAQTANGEVKLTSREMKLLELLIQRKGKVVSREEILKEVWGYDDVLPNTRTIDNFILNFRKYFEKDPKNPQYFESVWGVGYRFVE